MESRFLAYFRWHDCTSSSRIERNVEGDTLAGAARCKLHSSGLARKYVPSARWCVLSPVRWDKRSQMGSFRGRRGGKERKRGAICTRVHTMVLIVGIAPNYATFCGQRDGDADNLALYQGRDPSSPLFQLRSITSGRCSRGSFSESSRNCLATHLFPSDPLKREREREGGREVNGPLQTYPIVDVSTSPDKTRDSPSFCYPDDFIGST